MSPTDMKKLPFVIYARQVPNVANVDATFSSKPWASSTQTSVMMFIKCWRALSIYSL